MWLPQRCTILANVNLEGHEGSPTVCSACQFHFYWVLFLLLLFLLALGAYASQGAGRHKFT